jgi:hypothetical protein
MRPADPGVHDERKSVVRPRLAIPVALSTTFVCAFAASAVGGSAGSSRIDPAPPSAFRPARLYQLPPRVSRRCRKARRLALCPRRMPRPWIRPWRAPQGSPMLQLNAHGYGPFRDGRAWLVELSFGYGQGPWEPGGDPRWREHVWRNRPCCFLHFELYRALSGRPPIPRTAKRATLGGRRGLLAPANGYAFGCANGTQQFFCNHWRFFWRQRGGWYVATLHHFGPDTRKLLFRLIAELRPRR